MVRLELPDTFEILKESGIMDESGVVVFVIDRKGKIEYVNDQIEKVLAYSREQLFGKNVFRFVALEEKNQLKEILRKDIKGRVTLSNLAIFCSKCLTHYFDGFISPLSPYDTERVVLYLHNVTERAEHEKRLEKVNKALDDFTYKVSHDLKAPLKSMEGLVQLMKEDKGKNEEQYLTLMDESLDRLNKYISQMVNDARKGAQSKITHIDIEMLVEEIRSNFQFIPTAANIRFEPVFKLKKPVYTDYLRIQMILNNLISNSIKYHRLDQEDPYVKVAIRSNADKIQVEVKDNGIGIEEDRLEDIFKKWERASEKVEGTGVGLHIVKKAVMQMEGRIEVESQLGKGSKFTVVLPNLK